MPAFLPKALPPPRCPRLLFLRRGVLRQGGLRRRALQLDSSFAAAWTNLGNDAARQKQRRRTIRFYAKARKAYPAKASVLIGRAYAALRKADSARQAYEETLRHTRRAHKLKPQSADYRYLLGAQLVQAGRVEEAIGHLERVAKRKPWHYGAEYNLGQALLQQGGRAKEAERHLARADSLRRLQNDIGQLRSMIQTQPKNPEYWKRLAEKLRQAGREEEAAQGPHADAAMTAFTGETERTSEAAFKVARATFRREHALYAAQRSALATGAQDALFLLLGVAVLLWVHHAVGPAVLANSKSWLLLALVPFLTRLVLWHLRHANTWGCSTTAEGGDCAKTRCTGFMRKRCLIVLTLPPRKTIG